MVYNSFYIKALAEMKEEMQEKEEKDHQKREVMT